MQPIAERALHIASVVILLPALVAILLAMRLGRARTFRTFTRLDDFLTRTGLANLPQLLTHPRPQRRRVRQQ